MCPHPTFALFLIIKKHFDDMIRQSVISSTVKTYGNKTGIYDPIFSRFECRSV